MKIFKKRFSKKAKIQIAIGAAVIVALIAAIIIDVCLHGPLYHFGEFLADRERVSSTISAAGVWAPVLYILLQIAQTVLAPIPGGVVGIVGGFLFGWWGVLWTLIGSTIGYAIALYLSRKLGRPFVEKVVSKELLNKFDYLADNRGPLVFFLIFLIPGLPDDIVMYIAGLSKISLRKLLAMATIGRIPAMIGTNMIGHSVGNADIVSTIAITTICVLILVIVAMKRDAIMKWLDPQNPKADQDIDLPHEKIDKDWFSLFCSCWKYGKI